MVTGEVKAIVFDFDGTLVNTERAICDAANAVCVEHGLRPLSFKQFRMRSENGWEWYKRLGVNLSSDEIAEAFFRYYDNSSCDLMPHTLTTLGLLNDKGIQCAVVSAYKEPELKLMLAQHGLSGYITQVIGGVYSKAPAIMRVCDEMGFSSRFAVYVGDLLCDVRDALEAEATPVLFAPEEYPHGGLASRHITCLSMLPTILGL